MQIVINGILTHYELINPKAETPVIVLHGWGQNSSHWLPLAKKISDQFRLYLLDLPGFGGTKNLAGGSGIPEYVKFVKNFAAKNNLKKITLVGHSFGGQIAAEFALKFPGLLNKTIFIDAAIVRKRKLLTGLKILAAKIIKLPTLFLPGSLREKILTFSTPKDYAQANPYQRSVLKKILRQDIGAKVHLIKIPTEIIWGSEDKEISYQGKFLVEAIPSASLHIIYGADHSPQLGQPNKLAAILNQIFSENEPT
ncbi:MAG: alpha/beta hydrolase [Microgenomates group bacterium]